VSDTIAILRRRIAELADRTVDSAQYRARLEAQLMRVRKALETGLVSATGKENGIVQ